MQLQFSALGHLLSLCCHTGRNFLGVVLVYSRSCQNVWSYLFYAAALLELSESIFIPLQQQILHISKNPKQIDLRFLSIVITYWKLFLNYFTQLSHRQRLITWHWQLHYIRITYHKVISILSSWKYIRLHYRNRLQDIFVVILLVLEPRQREFWPSEESSIRCRRINISQDMCPAVHSALREPQPKRRTFLQKPPSTNPLVFVPDLLNSGLTSKSILQHRGTAPLSVCRETPRSQSKKSDGVYHFLGNARAKGIHHRSERVCTIEASGTEEKKGFHSGAVYDRPHLFDNTK